MLDQYRRNGAFDELVTKTGAPRYPKLAARLETLNFGDLTVRQKVAEEHLREKGITFAVYGHSDGTEKVWPFDIVPRAIPADEWQQIERGLKQRIRALNLFLDDVYGPKKILKDKVVPEELVLSAKTYRPLCEGLKPPKGVWTHVTGTDLVRDKDGTIYVLEDNLRCPSGVSYVLENRELMKRVMPEVFRGSSIAPVEHYPEQLLKALVQTAPPTADRPTVKVG